MSASDQLPGFVIDGIQVWPDSDVHDDAKPNVWRWLPGAPTAQPGPDGKAQMSLMDTGQMVMLQLGAQLSAPQTTLDGLSKQIAAKSGVDVSGILLMPATVTITKAAVLAGPPDARQEVCTARPSNMVPFLTAFSAMLTGEMSKAVLAALGGTKERMLLRYEGTVALVASADASLSGDLTQALPDIEAPADDAAARAVIAGLVKSGSLKWSRSADAAASDALKTRTDDAALERATKLLRGLSADAALRAPDTANLAAAAHLSEPRTVAFRRESDIADWFAPGEGAKHIVKMG